MRAALLLAALLLMSAPMAAASETELVCFGQRGVSYELDGSNSHVHVGDCSRQTIFDPVFEGIYEIIDQILVLVDAPQ